MTGNVDISYSNSDNSGERGVDGKNHGMALPWAPIRLDLGLSPGSNDPEEGLTTSSEIRNLMR